VFRAQKPRLWSDARVARAEAFDVLSDGDRIASVVASELSAVPTSDKVVFVFNLFDELRRLAPVR
jgi:hypothetical protein